ncbi:MAG: SMC-Scp complex subunit ScpB [Clostridia bacterium]|jgi:segregation and condensation protein B|nr:SMC-Scp complex subunit ScpB [Clostridia bacterium]MDH7573572.1 SMC-Scp complex subunit ScpB [Clostridia bacterium]
MKEKVAALESLLFASGEALTVAELSQLLEADEAEVRELARELAAHYDREGHALTLLEVAEGYRLATRPEYREMLEKLFLPRSQRLSRAALETLAIVAYLQPVTKAQIEEIRGVRVEGVLATLVEKGLVQEVGRKEAPGRPVLYGTTRRFLDHFGLRDLGELPPLPEESTV